MRGCARRALDAGDDPDGADKTEQGQLWFATMQKGAVECDAGRGGGDHIRDFRESDGRGLNVAPAALSLVHGARLQESRRKHIAPYCLRRGIAK